MLKKNRDVLFTNIKCRLWYHGLSSNRMRFDMLQAKAMTAALTIPHLGYCDEVDLSELVKLRSSLRSAAEARGLKFTYMPVFIKVTLSVPEFIICNLF